ncbi:MAG: acetyl-CoA hydrolase/transferase C-terminal domain-containing protein [Pseudomonadota bacterium]
MTDALAVDDVVGLLRPGMSVWIAGGTNEPLGFVDALKRNPESARGVNFYQSTVPGLNHTDYSAFHPEATMTVFLLTPELRKSYQAGRVLFIPKQLRAISDFFETELAIDLAVTQLAPTDQANELSYGLNSDFLDAAIANAKCVVGEINRAQWAPVGAPTITRSTCHHLYSCDVPLPTFPELALTDEARTIGTYVAELVSDGACIQTGIGSIPAGVLAALEGKNDLGLHSGIIDDGIMKLADAGVINGRCKTIDQGRIITAISIGTDRLYEWSAKNDAVAYRPVSYTHSNTVLAQLDNFTSINSAIEVDLFGQVNAEMVGGRQLSGTGGSVDFMRGASAAKNGKSILALTATASRGTISRIVPALAPQTTATALRTDIDYVVTEFGVAHVRNLTTVSRGDALIDIAPPQFRDELRREWATMKKNL